MATFNELPGSNAVVSKGGVYSVCKLFELEGEVFALLGKGYVGLNADKSSTMRGVTWRSADATGGRFGNTKLGRLKFERF